MQQQQEWGKEKGLVGSENHHIRIPGLTIPNQNLVRKTLVKSILLYLKPLFHNNQTKINTGQPNNSFESKL